MTATASTSGSSSHSSSALPHVEQLDTVVIRFCGDSGDGMQLTGSEFTHASALLGNDLSTLPDYPAEIRAPAGTLAGVSGFQLQFASSKVFTPGDEVHTLVAMNPAALKTNLADVIMGGILLVNSSAFTPNNLRKAGYDTSPLEDGSLEGYRLHQIDITGLTRTALAGSGLSSKAIERCKNFLALGVAFWLFHRPTAPEEAAIAAKFARRPELAEANIKVFKAGYHYGETAEMFTETYRVAAAPIAPGRYRNLKGNAATAIGLVTGCQLADVHCFFAGYPITPASDILHFLSAHRAWNVTTFQAEDEIAAVGAALGASFGGSLGITATSGPGAALKTETMGLAVTLELPMVIVNVQRGGPSTGLPTKTEQADLLQMMYGRNGESPCPIIAARTPADCFSAALEAVRVAIRYMTPVVLMTDGYLANGSEPWKLPEPGELEREPVVYRTEPDGYHVYQRDPDTLARAWVRPGTPGMAHRVGGLEKDALTGNVSYDPANHELMCRTRQQKVERVRQIMGPLHLDGPPTGDVLLVGWGSTYGAIAEATRRMRGRGYQVSHTHLRWLNPLRLGLDELMRGFRRVLVPELNLGQLSRLLRAELLVDAISVSKVQGKPFKVAEICAAVEKHGRADA